MPISVRKKRAKTRMKVKRFLARVRKSITYGEAAKKLHTSSMALGQILKGIVNDNPKDRKLTRKVVAKKVG